MGRLSYEFYDQSVAVITENDRQDIWKELSSQKPPIGVITEDDNTFVMSVNRIENAYLLMNPMQTPRAPKLNESVYVVFSLKSGQYSMKGQIIPTKEGIIAFSLKAEVRRLQRRNNFRVPVLKSGSCSFVVKEFNGQKIDKSFLLNDLSAGGLSFVASPNQNMQFQSDMILSGELNCAGRKISDLVAKVCYLHLETNADVKVGLQFKNLNSKQEQDLLASTLAIHRQNLE